MYGSAFLENKELMALYGGERDYFVEDEDCTSEEFEVEYSEEGKRVRGVRSSLALEIYGLQREQHVYFSNQEYYKRLEELRNAHLRNMAELEKMYLNQDRERHGEDREATSIRKLQRINSQEELDFHETSSGSDQSELYRTESIGELELDSPKGIGQEQTYGRAILLNTEDVMSQKQFQLQPKASYQKMQGALSCHTGVRVRSNSKVTVPKPFQMMLREEERKRRKVRTRSEIELENTLLRRQLEYLQECQKKFRATPAPAHTHLPLYEIISCSGQKSGQSRSSSNNTKRNQGSTAASLQPFHFLERENKKKEAKIVAELGKVGPKEERQQFKARPMPRSVYGIRHKADNKSSSRQPKIQNPCTVRREATKVQSDPNSDLEPDTSLDSCRPQKCVHSKSLKKQIELSIELSTDPLKATTCKTTHL